MEENKNIKKINIKIKRDQNIILSKINKKIIKKINSKGNSNIKCNIKFKILRKKNSLFRLSENYSQQKDFNNKFKLIKSKKNLKKFIVKNPLDKHINSKNNLFNKNEKKIKSLEKNNKNEFIRNRNILKLINNTEENNPLSLLCSKNKGMENNILFSKLKSSIKNSSLLISTKNLIHNNKQFKNNYNKSNKTNDIFYFTFGLKN